MSLISVIIPVYNGESFLGRAVESVLTQDCSDIEVIIVDDGSTDSTAIVAGRYLKDPRVRYERVSNGGVSRALNYALPLTRGEYIAILHADDVLVPGKLKKQAGFMDKCWNYGVSYTSERYFLESTPHEAPSPYSKFSGDIFFFLKRNNFIHISTAMFRKKTLEGVIFDESLRCHEDWDLFLRLSAAGTRFGYIAEELSRISINAGSLSADNDIMVRTGRVVGLRSRELWKAMKRKMNIYSVGGISNTIRYICLRLRAASIGFPDKSQFNKSVPRNTLSAMRKTCDIIMPVHGQLEMTKKCLDSIFANTRGAYSVILIDNASDPQTNRFLKGLSSSRGNVILLENKENIGWVKAVNQGLKASGADYVFIMNNDTVVRTPDWTTRLVEIATADSSIGLVNPAFEIKKPIVNKPCIEIDFCRGYCMMIKRRVIDAIGGLEEAYGIGYYDDDDYSVRAIRAGFKCVRANNVFVEHLRDSTFSALFTDEKRRELHRKNKELFYSKWGRRLNIFFIVSGSTDIEKLSSLFFTLARRQHIIYVWSLVRIPALNHINIRMIPFARFMFPLSGIMLFFNSKKRPAKRYDLVFHIGSDKIDERSLLDKVDKAAKI